jgi:hypothetical protein
MSIRLVCLGVVASLHLIFAGCATYKMAQPCPATPSPAKAEVSKELPSKWSSFPVGVYFDEAHRMAFTGHQGGEMAGMMFGVVGVLVADGVNSANGKARFEDSTKALSFDVVALTNQALATRLAAPDGGKRLMLEGEAPNKATLEIMPYVLMDFDANKTGHLYVVMNVKLMTRSGPHESSKVVWETRYIAQAPGVYPLDPSTKVWDKDNKASAAVAVAVDRAVWAILADANGQLNQTRTVTYSGVIAWISRIQVSGVQAVVAGETADVYALRMIMGDAAVCAGVHVVEKSSVTLTDAKFKIPTK